jgi:hypothetical protein
MKKFFNRVVSALKSRTIWTIIVITILNGVPAASDLIPPSFLPYVDFVLGFLAIYFRVNPRVKF